MPDRCSAVGCSNSKVNCPNVSFFRFPKDLERCKVWSDYAGRELLDPIYMNNNLRLCSVHFSDNQFSNSAHTRLVFYAVPDVEATRPGALAGELSSRTEPAPICRPIFSGMQFFGEDNSEPEPDEPVPAKRARNDCPFCEKKEMVSVMVQTDPTCATGLLTINSRVDKLEEKVKRLESTMTEMAAQNHDLRNTLAEQNGVVMSPGEVELFGVRQLRSTQHDGLFYHHTGFTYRSFSKLFQFLDKETGRVHYAEEAIPHVYALSPEDQLLLTLMRLRNRDSVEELSLRFGIPPHAVGALFDNWLDHMFSQFHLISIWPDRDIIIQNMSTDYSRDFPTTLAMVDCTEVIAEEVGSDNVQNHGGQCSSSYSVLKGLVATDPRGYVMFASALCAKAISPDQLYKGTGFGEFLQELKDKNKVKDGDSIMVQESFDIRDQLAAVGLTLCSAPTLTAPEQLTPQRLALARKMAPHRIHIKQTIARIKGFQILNGVLPRELLRETIDKLWFVCTHLTNFQDRGISKS